jgi:hypothetical protein
MAIVSELELRATIMRWLALLPVAGGCLSGCGVFNGKCAPVDTVVPLEHAQSVEARSGSARDAGSVAGATAVTAENCSAVCRTGEPGVMITNVVSCEPTTTSAGAPAAHCVYEAVCPGGRTPAGLASRGDVESRSEIASYLCRMAHAEAASVDAFEILEAELAAHGAPLSLRRAAKRAARDEVRHARIMTALARAYGAEPVRPIVQRPPVRALVDIAIENATEGCVAETYAAAVAHAQSRAASDPRVRRAMRSIARDETFHATLAWRVAAWLDTRLTAAERARVRDARDRAVATLRVAAPCASEPASIERLGVPRARENVALIELMARDLWS